MAIDSTASVIDRGSFSVTSLSPSSPHPLSLAPSLPSTRSFPLPPSAPPLLLTLPPLPDHLQACSPGIESHKYPANAESLGRVGQPPIHQNSDLVDPPLQAEGGGGGRGRGDVARTKYTSAYYPLLGQKTPSDSPVITRKLLRN